MNLAELTEPRLFNLLKIVIPDLETKDTMSRHDCYSKLFDMAIELKCRRKEYNEVLIEKDKFIYLKQFPNSRYIISDPLGIYSFNIGNIQDLVWYEHKMPATTEFENTQTISKKVGYIPKVYAINITNKLIENEANKRSL